MDPYNIVVVIMNRIRISDYSPSMGKLIDLEDPSEYAKDHVPGSINIPYETLIVNHKKYLEKNTPYYLICKKGIRSKKAVNILEFYGYRVIQVLK